MNPTLSPFERFGGESGVRELVDAFYDRMDFEPEFATIRELHPTTLEESRNKLYWFLCGWLGGPNLYVERFGHPRLRARHLPFSIGTLERDQWMACMKRALTDCETEEKLAQWLLQQLFGTADWMRNREG
ncbi:MAG: cyanoglobin [Burkholderiales bacterium]|nr:MAG: cyanoglobin [Burkholderiales bacterium]TAG83219.1 MAG: cyanoglobin [Betaproteobacteria bacterium]